MGGRYDPWVHVSRARIGIEWDASCLPRHADHVVVSTPDKFILRPGLESDRLNAAVATALAERDLRRRGARADAEDPATVAAQRLVSFWELRDAMGAHRGGITAVARALSVPPPVVRRRLTSLNQHESDVIDKAVNSVAGARWSRTYGQPCVKPQGRASVDGPAITLTDLPAPDAAGCASDADC